MKNFMDENFLLQTETAQKLYHEHAAKMPIIDYHCHLIPQMVADDYKFKSLTEIWLGGDHYKWRAMRTNGVDERYCTGKDTTDWEKFEKWAETVPYTFRNHFIGARIQVIKDCLGQLAVNVQAVEEFRHCLGCCKFADRVEACIGS